MGARRARGQRTVLVAHVHLDLLHAHLLPLQQVVAQAVAARHGGVTPVHHGGRLVAGTALARPLRPVLTNGHTVQPHLAHRLHLVVAVQLAAHRHERVAHIMEGREADIKDAGLVRVQGGPACKVACGAARG